MVLLGLLSNGSIWVNCTRFDDIFECFNTFCRSCFCRSRVSSVDRVGGVSFLSRRLIIIQWSRFRALWQQYFLVITSVGATTLGNLFGCVVGSHWQSHLVVISTTRRRQLDFIGSSLNQRISSMKKNSFVWSFRRPLINGLLSVTVGRSVGWSVGRQKRVHWEGVGQWIVGG